MNTFRTTPLKSLAASIALTLGAWSAQAQTFPATGVPVTVPDGAGLGCTTPGVQDIAIPVSGVTGSLTDISASLSLNSTWVGDAVAELRAPGGAASLVLFGRIGAITPGGAGYGSNLDGAYRFVDPTVSANNIWTAAAAVGSATVIPPGTYATTQIGGAGVTAPAPTVPFLAAFSGLAPAQINGTWTLRVSDCSTGDRLAVNAASLTLSASPAVTAVPTLGEWGLLVTGLLAAGLGATRLRRRT